MIREGGKGRELPAQSQIRKQRGTGQTCCLGGKGLYQVQQRRELCLSSFLLPAREEGSASAVFAVFELALISKALFL